MKPITKEQSKKLHTLLSQLKLMDSKNDMIYDVTGGRATSSKDLTTDEALILIKHLSQFDNNDKMRRKVYALAYEAGIIYGDTLEDKKMNTAKLNQFLKTRGAVKKNLHSLNHSDLIKVVSQFQSIVKHSKESKDNKQAKNITDSLLNELNISTH